MVNGWKRHSITDLISQGVLLIGDGYRAKNEELSTSGLPFVRASNIDNRINLRNVDRFPEADLARVGNKVSRPGDVVFTSKGTVGRFAFITEDKPQFVYSPQLCFWRVMNRARIDAHYLFFWMLGREFFLQYSSVKGQPDKQEKATLTVLEQAELFSGT